MKQHRQFAWNVTLKALRVTIFLQWKNKKVLHILNVLFLAFGIQYAMRMLHDILYPVALQYFSTLSHKWYAIRKRVIEYKM
jgi:hypothetical protein